MSNLKAAYHRDVDTALARYSPAAAIVDADLAHLPEPVQRYLRIAGVVGQPRVRNFRARMHGRIKLSSGWLAIRVEQYNFFDEPARLCLLEGSMFLLPIRGYHRYVGPSATMTVRAAGLVTVAHASGPEMDQGETVTMFNDLCVMAPGALIDRAIVWEGVDARTARAAFTNAGHTIRAELVFSAAGELTNFFSDDRYQTSPDGKTARKVRWSTPLDVYRRFGPFHLPRRGAAWWHESDREYPYIELDFDDIAYNLTSRRAANQLGSPVLCSFI
jgi:hypothetical protein